ncbi:MAG: PEP-CTERM sorting domain-containing protein, partial [Pirellulales bacterium]
DQLNVTGLFMHGGTVTIDVSQFVPPAPQQLQLKLIGWGSEAGDRGDTLVSFIGGDALPIAYRSDGLYVTAAVPEPGAMVLLAMGLVVLAPASRRLRRAGR